MKKIITILLGITLVYSCTTQKNEQLPVLTTTDVILTIGGNASSGGNITDIGSSAITARGLVWSASSKPTISLNTKSTDGSGNGVFTSAISGLTSGTTYFVRAYATNSSGTSYGNEITFTETAVPTNGLVGYWPFTGNANDSSGNGNNGTVNGATLTTDRFGTINNAYNFSNSNINIPMTITLHNLPVRTFSCWFYANGTQNGGRLYETTYFNGGIAIRNTNFLDAWYYNGINECNVSNVNIGILNQWHNLIYITNSNTGQGIIYLDGISVGSRIGLAYNSPSNWVNNFLRIGSGAQNESFNGKIDEIAIWNRALTQVEITALYNSNGK